MHSIHFGVGLLLSAPEMQLSDEEARQFADAAVNVAKQYDIGASAKAIAWTDLVMVAGGIYGVRAMQIVGRRQAQRSSSPQAFSGQVRNGVDRSAPAPIDLSLMTGRGNA